MMSARYIARGSCLDGFARSLAVNVTTPKPRNAKNVSATLDTMSCGPGYVDGARLPGSMLATVTSEKNARMPITTKTTRLWTRATTPEPAMLRMVIVTNRATAKIFTHVALSPANAEL